MKKSMSSNLVVHDDTQDILGSDYRARTLTLSDDKVSTLIHYAPTYLKKKSLKKESLKKENVKREGTLETSTATNLFAPTNKAILYIHGYTDYFFQTGMAEYFYELGYHFYAIDLQGYGRSSRPNISPININSFADYHQDLSTALAVMQADGVTECIPLAHSMGALVLNNYLRANADKHSISGNSQVSKKESLEIKGLILNSPFFALPMSLQKEKYILPIYRFLAKYCSFITLDSSHENNYSRSLHTSLAGEWAYRLDWKPASGFPLSFSWVNQVIIEQTAALQAPINIPTLLCRSNLSTYFKREIEAIRMGDGVLDVENIETKAQAIYPNLSVSIVENGFHDLYLSPEPIRNNYMNSIKTWLQQTQA